MKRVFIASALITIAVASVLTASFAYLSLTNVAKSKEEPPATTATSTAMPSSRPLATPNQSNNSSVSPSTPYASSSNSSATSAPSSSATTETQTPASTYAPDSAYPEGREVWLPYVGFGLLSPANQTYNTSSVILKIEGITIAGTPSFSYSLDGGPRTSITLEFNNVTMSQTSFTCSTSLPNLANGSHVIVLYGDLSFQSKKCKITTVFDVEAVT